MCRPPDKYQALLDGKASYVATTIIGHRHLFIEGEILSVTPVAMHYRQKFPWEEEINKVRQ